MEIVYNLMTFLFPFDFLEMTFMKNALLGVLLAAPLLGLLSTMVVNGRMAFFSDAIGHSSLTGIGIGVILGFKNPSQGMIPFAIILGIGITYLTYKYPQTTDTVIGVFSAISVALGVMMLSSGGNFNRYTNYLIGDLLSMTKNDLLLLLLLSLLILGVWYFIFNQLVLTSLNRSLANSRKIHTLIVQMVFTVTLAIVVVLCIPWVGVMIINAFLILPAACSRQIAQSMRQYQLYAVLISVICGVVGLAMAYYLGTSAGATIVVVMGVFYLLTALYGHLMK